MKLDLEAIQSVSLRYRFTDIIARCAASIPRPAIFPSLERFHVSSTRCSTYFPIFQKNFRLILKIFRYVEGKIARVSQRFEKFSFLSQIEQSTRNFQIARVFYDPTRNLCKVLLDLSKF